MSKILSDKWADRCNAHGLHSKDRRLALMALDAVHDLKALEAENAELKRQLEEALETIKSLEAQMMEMAYGDDL